MGTPHYMAPEQAQGKRADSQSDLYSLGVVLYQMLTGEVPFDADTPWNVIRQHIDVQPKNVRQVRSDAPKALERVVSRCLEKDPKRRFQTPLELADALGQAVPQIAQAQQPPPQAAPPRREVRSSPSATMPPSSLRASAVSSKCSCSRTASSSSS